MSDDKYGNPIDGDRLIFCCFPDCGCDGARLCMAERGASDTALEQNVEGMYHRSDLAARKAKVLESRGRISVTHLRIEAKHLWAMALFGAGLLFGELELIWYLSEQL